MSENKHYEELERRMKIIKDRVRGVFHQHFNGMYLYGRPGTSKTYSVLTTLEALGANYTYHSGHLTPIGLFELLAENADRIIVLEDVSAIFNQPIALQLLLAALGNPHDASKIRRVNYKTARKTRTVSFTGGIICISNLPLDGHHHYILAAIKDRIFVINYEPTDEQIIALIEKLTEDGVGGVLPEEAKMVANFLISECKGREIRPSMRDFVDKALKDYQLYAAGKSETHWKDLVISNLEQQLIELQYPTNDLSRAEQTAAERRIAREIYQTHPTRQDRLEAWKAKTGKSPAAFYRRVKELKAQGILLDAA